MADDPTEKYCEQQAFFKGDRVFHIFNGPDDTGIVKRVLVKRYYYEVDWDTGEPQVDVHRKEELSTGY